MAGTFVRNTLLGFGSGGAVALAGFIGNAITARLLGPDKLGMLAYVVWCVTIGSVIASLGINIVQQRYLPRLRAEGRSDAAQGLIGATTRLSMAAAVVGSAVLFAYLFWAGSSAIDSAAGTSWIVVIGAALTWFLCWRMADTYLFYLRGEQRFGELASLSAISALLKVAVITLGAWLFGIPGAIAGYIAGNILPAARMLGLLRIKPSVDPELRTAVTKFALASWPTAVIGGLVFGRTEIVFLEHYTGLVAVGLFTAAATVAEMAVQLPPLVLSALLPRFSEQFGMGAYDRVVQLYQTMTAFIAMVIAPLCLGLAAISPVLVPFLFGEDFADAAPATAVLLVAASISSLGVTGSYLLQSMGKTGVLLISNGLGLIGTIALGFLLVPRFGLLGAAWSRGIVQVSVVLIETWYVTRRERISPPYRALGAIALASLAQGAVVYIISMEFGAASMLISIPAAVAVYLIGIRLLSVIPLVSPELPARAIDNAPQRIQPLVRRIVTILVPAAARPSESD